MAGVYAQEGTARQQDEAATWLPLTGQKELNAADGGDFALVRLALGAEVLGVAIEQVDVRRVNVNVLEEVAPHEGVVAFGVVAREAAVPKEGGSDTVRAQTIATHVFVSCLLRERREEAQRMTSASCKSRRKGSVLHSGRV
jgi:hypothetical protein